MTGFIYLGPPGRLLAVPAPARGMEHTAVVPTVVHQLLGGAVRVDRIGTPRRQFKLQWPWMSDADYQPLHDLHLGAYGAGPHILIAPPMTNMLPPNVSTGTVQLGDTTGWFASPGTITSITSTTATLGRCLQWAVPTGTAAFTAALTVGGSPTSWVPVLPSTIYTAQCRLWTDTGTPAFGPRVLMSWWRADGSSTGTFSAGSSVTLTTTPTTASCANITSPSDAAYCQVALDNSAATTTAVNVLSDQWMLTAATSTGTWVAGMGVPRVSITALAPTLPVVGRHTVSLELQEVG